LGGRNAGFTGSFAAADKPVANINGANAISNRTAILDMCFITWLVIARSVFMVNDARARCQVTGITLGFTGVQFLGLPCPQTIASTRYSRKLTTLM